jgi:hypothetical protein
MRTQIIRAATRSKWTTIGGALAAAGGALVTSAATNTPHVVAKYVVEHPWIAVVAFVCMIGGPIIAGTMGRDNPVTSEVRAMNRTRSREMLRNARARAALWILAVLILCLATCALSGCTGVQQLTTEAARVNGPVPVSAWSTDLTDYVGPRPFHEVATSGADFSYAGENPQTIVRVGDIVYASPKDVIGEGIEITTPEGLTFKADQLGADVSAPIAAISQQLIAMQGWLDALTQAQINRDDAQAAAARDGIAAAIEVIARIVAPLP